MNIRLTRWSARMPRFVIAFVVLAMTMSAVAPIRYATAQTADADPQVGDVIDYIGESGDPIGTITVDAYDDDYQGFGEFDEPQPGFRYVAAQVTIENTSRRPFEIDAYQFQVQDAEGFLGTQVYMYRMTATDPPDLEYQSLPGGDAATGIVVFEVLSDAELVRLFWAPSYERLILVADLRGAESTSLAADGTAARPTTPDVGVTPEEDDDDPFGTGATIPDAPVIGDVDCGEFAAYYEETMARLEASEELLWDTGEILEDPTSDLDTSLDALDQLEEVFLEIADAQADMVVPAGLEELNERIIEAYELMADLMVLLGDAAIEADGVMNIDLEADAELDAQGEEAIGMLFGAFFSLEQVAEDCGLATSV